MLSGGGPAVAAWMCWSSRPRDDPHPAPPDQVGARRPPLSGGGIAELGARL